MTTEGAEAGKMRQVANDFDVALPGFMVASFPPSGDSTVMHTIIDVYIPVHGLRASDQNAAAHLLRELWAGAVALAPSPLEWM